DGNIKDTPPTVLVPRMEDRAHWEGIAAKIVAARGQVDARKKAARGEFDKWLATAKPAAADAKGSDAGLTLHAKLGEGEGKTVNVNVNGKDSALTVEGVEWTPGKITPNAFQIRPGGTIELNDVGNFEKDQAFSCGMWVKIPK